MKKQHIFLLAILTVFYGYLLFITPTDASSLHKYHLSATGLHLLSLTLLVPIAIIWAVAFYGFSKFKDYAEYIDERPDGKHLENVALGLQVLAIGLVLSSILSGILQNLSLRNLSLIPATTIIENYISLLIALGAYYFIYKGSLGLATLTETKPGPVTKQWWLYLYALVGILYGYAALTSPNKNTPATAATHGLYYLPDVLILVSIILPYVIAWYLGIRGATLVAFYKQNTRGVVYKAALQKLSSGLAVVVVTSILVQFVDLYFSKHSHQLANSSLSSILVIIYVLIAVIAAGYLLIAQGARKLKKIEEVV